MQRFLIWKIVLALAFAGAAAASEPPVADRALTTVAQVKALAPQAADAARPVRLRGVITASLGLRSGAFLQDETGGVFVAPRKGEPSHVAPGDWVECRGVTAAGQYAPMVVLEEFVRLGRKELPAPVGVTLGEFAAGQHDGEWVETRGVVRTVALNPKVRPELQIAVGRERLRVQVCDLNGRAPEGLVNAEVRLAGVASGFFNRDRQLLQPVLFVPDWTGVAVTRPSSGDPFAAELRWTTSLFRYAPGERPAHWCRVRGAVTHALPGQALFLRDAEGALYVESRQTTPLKVGDLVEAVGFPAVRQGAAYLQDSVYRVVGTAAPPPAVPTDPAAIVRGLTRPSELVSIRGLVVETRTHPGRWLLTLDAGEQTFDVQVETTGAATPAAMPAVGTGLRATGILWTEDIDPRSRLIVPTMFRVLARSPADLEILQRPSWWTRARLLQSVAILAAIITAALVWIWMLRRRVEAQTATIAEKVAREAVAEERARTACEIHDTLAQGFMALGFQLEALSGELKEPAAPVRQHLDRAMKMLRHSHDEVRYSLKQLRAPATERKRLGAALQEAVGRATPSASPDFFRFTEQGESFPLPPVTEHNILRIGQEAATNAAKHAGARRLEMELRYDAREVRLRIADDGCGFDPARQGRGSGEHFGLHIMRERAQRIGGALRIESRPGGGTEILLAVPRERIEMRAANGIHAS